MHDHPSLFSRAACLAAFLLPILGFAERVPLWPEGQIPDCQTNQVAVPFEKMVEKGFDPAQHRMPYLEWSAKPKKPNGACVILISGGGYGCTCDGPSFKPLEKLMLDNGIACVWLWYRTPRPQGLPIHQSAWEDGQRAVRLVRAAAKERGIDPERIGVLGCSAGSHLSLLLATSALTPAYARVDATDDLPCHVNWAIPMCPAYVLTDGLTDRNSRDGDAPDVKLSPLFKFDAKTCPMCFFHGGSDIYSPNASTQLYRQLRRMKIPAELHLDGGRGHGPVDAAKFERAIEFMRQMGFLGKLAPAEDLMKRYPSDAARAKVERFDVWPKGKMPDVNANQCQPYIEWHTPKVLRTKAIQIIYSGGSYNGNSPDGHEVAPARRFLNEKGMTVVTLKYRTPRPRNLQKHVTAWQDLQRAIRIVRAKAKNRGLDPNRIGIMGSSAGGHLTLMGATSSRHLAYNPIDSLDNAGSLWKRSNITDCSAQWAIAIYPAYALTDGAEQGNATGGNDDSARTVPEFSFDEATCPTLFIHGDADGWASMNSVKCWEQMRRMGIQSDLHTLALRPHCFQFQASPGTGSYTWLERIWEFLVAKKFVSDYDAEAQKPILKIAVMSDIQGYPYPEDAGMRNLERALDIFAPLKPDLVINDGDINDSGRDMDAVRYYKKRCDARLGKIPHVVCSGNHEIAFIPKEMQSVRTTTNCVAEFYSVFGVRSSPLAERTIADYDFISLSFRSVAGYSAEDLKLLEEALERAVRRDAKKPIFVVTHYHPSDTVNSSGGSDSAKNLRALLDRYPQVVNLSGHTHNPLQDPRSIWQGGFTVVDTSTLCYGCIDTRDPAVNQISCLIPYGHEAVGVLFLEVYKDRLVLRRFSARDRREIEPENPWSFPLPYDPKHPKYDFASRAEATPAPEFPSDPEPTIWYDYGLMYILFEAATDPSAVYSYRIELTEAGGEAKSYRLLSDYYRIPEHRQKRVVFRLPPKATKPGKTYRCRIFPVGFFGKEGTPCEWSFTHHATYPETSFAPNCMQE